MKNNNNNIYLVIAIVILILGFIGGIVIGNVYKIVELVYESSVSPIYNEYESTFNGALMLYCWIGTILFDIFIFAVHSICYRLDLIIDNS